MEGKKIVILGGGNLGGAMAEGLIKFNSKLAAQITVTRRKSDQLTHLAAKGVHTTSDNKAAVASSDVVVIAVKPKQALDLLNEVKPVLSPDRHIIVSCVTGISIAEMQAVVGPNIPTFRAMPNTAIAIQQSMTCISYKADEKVVFEIFEKLGRAIIIDEELMGSATVLGACGIAFALRFIRAASQGGIEIGFDAPTAQLIASQTVRNADGPLMFKVLGAAALLQQGGQHPEREIDKGCTIAGLNEMEHQGFSSSLIKGIITSYNKIPKISHEPKDHHTK